MRFDLIRKLVDVGIIGVKGAAVQLALFADFADFQSVLRIHAGGGCFWYSCAPSFIIPTLVCKLSVVFSFYQYYTIFEDKQQSLFS